jgi:hypothetical protein
MGTYTFINIIGEEYQSRGGSYSNEEECISSYLQADSENEEISWMGLSKQVTDHYVLSWTSYVNPTLSCPRGFRECSCCDRGLKPGNCFFIQHSHFQYPQFIDSLFLPRIVRVAKRTLSLFLS